MDTSKEEYEIALFKLLGALWRKAWLLKHEGAPFGTRDGSLSLF